jgi:hypothetical protein
MCLFLYFLDILLIITNRMNSIKVIKNQTNGLVNDTRFPYVRHSFS